MLVPDVKEDSFYKTFIQPTRHIDQKFSVSEKDLYIWPIYMYC